jgi:hypothetical protein
MISYTIAMSFISWAMAIMMLVGLGLFKIWEYDANNPNSKTDDSMKMGMQMLIEEYHESGFAGKVTMILFFGAFFFATLISIIRGDFKDE